MKRISDILGSVLGLIMFSSVRATVAYKICRDMGSPVLFRQKRPGMHRKPIQMIKAHTMRGVVDAKGHPLPDAERLTSLGRFLRSSSLNELSELWNVLKSGMSLVGPCPRLMEYLPLYFPDQARRHEVHLSITDWAQLNGRREDAASRAPLSVPQAVPARTGSHHPQCRASAARLVIRD
jgi:lipopolysaccharide/colanic/teichoic acid biosynthesis glycosyltransferase